jgi:hypothetical protein
MSKYSLSKRYKRDRSEAWFFPLGNEDDPAAPAFKVRSFFPRGIEFQRIAMEVTKGVADQVSQGTLSVDDDRKYAIKAFIKASMLDWRNVTDDETGEAIPFSPEAALKLFDEFEELFVDVREYAAKRSNFIGEEVADKVAKN